MSWLLVALIPGLLMLATFGLQRLESRLTHDTVSAADVAEFLAQAGDVDVNTLARHGMSRALDRLHQRQHANEARGNGASADSGMSALPTRLYVQHRGNTEFRPTPHANRV